MAITPMAFSPATGLLDTVTYPTNPENETAARTQIQGRLNELRDYNNNVLIPALVSTTDSASGADQIGVTAIPGWTGSKIQAVLESAKAATQPLDATLTAVAAMDSTAGLVVQTGADAFTKRELAAPAAGISITNPAGTAGNPTFALTNDLAALEGLSSTGIAVRSAADTWVQRTITGTTNQVTVTNGDGVSGNPTLSLPQDIHTGATPAFAGAVLGGVTLTNQSLWGTAADGAVSNITDADINATTVAQSGTVALTHNRTIRATGAVTLSQAITVNKQDGQARGSFPTTFGSPGVSLGSVMAALGSKGIPGPIRPGGGTTGLCGGIVQILAKGNVAVNSTITAQGANASADGGGGGGLVVIVSAGTISGSGAIDVSAAAGHATAAGLGGSGSYSEEPGGHAGFGGSAGGSGPVSPDNAGGAGFIAGNKGGKAVTGGGGGGGGGSIDNAGSNSTDVNGAAGGAGNSILANYATSRLGYMIARPTVATSGDGGLATGASGTVGAGGINGGGGGGGAGTSGGYYGGAGGHAAALSGSGGGCAGRQNSESGYYGVGGNGGSGSPNLYALSSLSLYAGMPGGMGGGGGGYGEGSGSGGAGASGVSPFVASCGNGAGGTGGNGAAGSLVYGGNGGAGGNGGGAAGLVLLIAPTITYSGTVTGRLVTISGTAAQNFLASFSVA